MARQSGQIRIIGGEWRSRKLRFPAVAGLRPSPDAVRETLFNWLRMDISDSHCLDLYAGSGALGFEAASRGAARVVMVESKPEIARQLRENTRLLEAGDRISIEHAAVDRYLASCSETFDIVFMDPPFNHSQLTLACELISSSAAVGNSTLLYLESARSRIPLPIPPSWHIIRQKNRGLVQSTLIQTTLP